MPQGSNYLHLLDPGNSSQPGNNREHETPCKPCYGSGSDRDGADCIPCEGMGSVITRY